MTEGGVDTANYLEIAFEDDIEAESSAQGGANAARSEDGKSLKQLAREKRIAEAVQRSKIEYKDEHAFTERGWITSVAAQELAQTSSIDAHKFESVLVSLYYGNPPQYQAIVDSVISVIDPKARTSGGLTREVLDMGIRAAMACDDSVAAVRLARLSKPMWNHQMAGLAADASDALASAGHLAESLEPLLMSTSIHGLHVPLLVRMQGVLERIRGTLSESQARRVDHLICQIHEIVTRRRTTFDRPLLPDRPDVLLKMPVYTSLAAEAESGSAEELCSTLGLSIDSFAALDGTLRRLEKGLRGSDPQTEEPRSVRTL
ncbi:hypothetical protein BD324DRAFT_613895 [Kockovaella imperatae]|uniref:Uncharacterized protein n=1 Tax=Kockovaella imperatae TaxID=4999 RepID=A0A1Y1UTI7_9TREE|nr:hypothetical protein BD324DRAFT_613895 [Kockovaella imperatae]ORX41272.1 hypothetical protein BD324DRAFT_613895 [Kockovaella imperatae]